MGCGVFIHRADAIYDDSPAEQYQFPRQCLSRAQAAVRAISAVFPKEYEPTVGTLLGALISEMKAASQFWFGTSSEGRRQTELLASAPAIDRRGQI